jgi:GxGYxYP putative glycoside hydrolase C-terminal domain/GxGYxY sequence motif in domain of unknown function N-terminal
MRFILVLVLASSFGLLRSVAADEASPPKIVWTFDAQPLHALDLSSPANARQLWDTMHTLAALQGLANRQSPRLYLFCCHQFGVDTDRFWLDWFRGEDGWLRDTEIRPLPDLESVVATFRSAFDGLVVYDGDVPATAAIASTAAGVEQLLPVRYDPATNSVYTRLTGQHQLPVKLWLVHPDGSPLFNGRDPIPGLVESSTTSPKIDAYHWALARYLSPGRCGAGLAAYYVDAFWLTRPTQAQPDMHTLSNHDWFIARRAFFFDLSPWGDEAPVDEPNQALGADKRCLLDVLSLLYRHADAGMVRIGGFPPWPFKYTTHGHAGRHEGVSTEWEFTRLISQFNGYKEADAAGPGAIANASFFQHYPLKRHYRQPNPKPALADWRSRGLVDDSGKVIPRLYLGHYVGDYDSPSWLYKAVPAFFRDPKPGQVPLGWAFDPNLADRAPQALAYAYRHASSNDFFIAGDSGAGYLNPRALSIRPQSGLPSGLASWEEHCRHYFARWDMSITGFILDGASGASTDTEFAAYQRFAPDGAGTHFESGPAMHMGLPTCPERDLPDSSEAAAALIADRAKAARGRPVFLWARSILKPPGWYADVSRLLAERHPEAPVAVVDPYTFFGLIRLQLTSMP